MAKACNKSPAAERPPAPQQARRSAAGDGGAQAAHSRAADDGRLGGEHRQRGKDHDPARERTLPKPAPEQAEREIFPRARP